MQAPGPAGRAGGVAYRCATPFAAGQAPAVRRQPPAIDRDCCVAITGGQPHANWQRAGPPMNYVSCAAAIRRGS
jgi:hypothetical protein